MKHDEGLALDWLSAPLILWLHGSSSWTMTALNTHVEEK